MNNIDEIKNQVEKVVNEVLEHGCFKQGDIFVVGCSSSEINGGRMGKNSSEEIGKTVFETIYSILAPKGIFIACQCCEHLNRALVVEKTCAEKYNYEIVNVVPWLHAGGSFATAAFHGLKESVVVEHVKANGGIDIGDVLIGMHLKDVAVPFHPTQNNIGQAHVVAAWCRPKFIGGCRAQYS